MEKNKHIVCLGGGDAMPKAVLEGLRKEMVHLSVISAMLDSGGSAGRERKYFKTGVSFGDLRRAALALSEAPAGYKDFLTERYQGGFWEGHIPINLYCTTTALVENNLRKGVEGLLVDIKEDLKIPEQYQLLPVTLDNSTLCAELENGVIIRGEGNIDVPKHDGNLKIKKVFLEPEAKAYPPALEAIKKADLIVLGPGDLYSSLSQILLVRGIPEAIQKSKAKKVYISNLMQKFGETNGFSVVDLAFEIERYLHHPVDYVVFNQKRPSPQRVAAYRKKHPELLDLVKFYEFLDKEKFVGEDFLTDKGDIIHHPEKLAKILLKL